MILEFKRAQRSADGARRKRGGKLWVAEFKRVVSGGKTINELKATVHAQALEVHDRLRVQLLKKQQ